MNEIVKSFDASAFFQNCNQIEMFFETAYEKLQYLQDDQLTDLYGYLSITHKHSWKMQCAILAEAQQRVKKRGGRIEEMEKVAGEFGIGRISMFRKAQVWNKFFQDIEKDFISMTNHTYRFDYFLDGYTWFERALRADNPLEAIDYAEKRYDELNGKYSTRDFHKDIKLKFPKQKRDALANASQYLSTPDDFILYYGDMQDECKKIDDNSIDLILTDPPYAEEYLPLWDELAIVSQRVLKPSSFLITYSGSLHLDYVMNTLGKYLSYYWILAFYHTQKTQLIHARNIIAEWKPILIFQKEPIATQQNTISDMINFDKMDKTWHDWQQGAVCPAFLIDNFSKQGNTVLDTFAGSGTFPVTAYKMNRKAIAIDNDLQNINIMKGLLKGR